MLWIIAILLLAVLSLLLFLLPRRFGHLRKIDKSLAMVQEYVQYLLFSPVQYAAHRVKFLEFLRAYAVKQGGKFEGEDATNKIALMSYALIDMTASKVFDQTRRMNARARCNPEFAKYIGEMGLDDWMKADQLARQQARN